MDLYTVSLATGAVGLVLMGVGGLAHGTHSGPAHAGHAHSGPSHVGHSFGAQARGGASAAHGAPAQEVAGAGPPSSPLACSSPSSSASASAALPPHPSASRSVSPLPSSAASSSKPPSSARSGAFSSASNPRRRSRSRAAIEDEARAVTGFDANGNGLVAVDVDGQVVQLLATLAPDDRARGVRIRSGDLVRIAEVDAARGRCTVTC